MTKAEVYEAISTFFYCLSKISPIMYDYWLSKLYDQDGDFVHTMWNERTLDLMEADIMAQLN